jgi:two-component system NtrC family sensor kinase
MKNALLAVCFMIGFQLTAKAQVSEDQISLYRSEFMKANTDSAKIRIATQLAYGYRFSNIDSANHYNDLAIALAAKLGLTDRLAQLLSLKSAIILEEGKLPEALQYGFEALKLAEEVDNPSIIGLTLNRIGNVYMELEDFRKALDYYKQSAAIFRKIGDLLYYNELSNIGYIYERLHQADSSLYYLKQVLAADTGKIKDRNKITYGELMYRIGNAYKIAGDTLHALEYYHKGIAEAKTDNDTRNLVMSSLLLAQLYSDMNLKDSSYRYARQALNAGRSISFRKAMYEASMLLSQHYRESSKWDSAYQYLNLATANKDSLTGSARVRKLQAITMEELDRQRKTEMMSIAKENRQKQLILLGGSLVLLTIAFLQYRNIRQKQKANKILEKTLGHLKTTQAQLIHAEKMASLGELTAGIAHEIQNPLNFVNNFSEVNTEMIAEGQDALKSGNWEGAEEILNSLADNNEKILKHGKRADAIVKGMLQHSQKGSGTKEPTNMNELVTEYLHLAFHGLRAKDNTFHASFKTDLDPAIGNVEVIPQDIGRVMLNLINNAFYAVDEKKKQLGEGYEPEVTVSTKLINAQDNPSIRQSANSLIISVRDNGNGIPETIRNKIFQPFFTTKPTGQGTGLGLSLSYDIIKAHGGEIRVESKERGGTTFIIQLPVG